MAQPASLSSQTVGDRTQVLTLDGSCDRSTAVEVEQRITTVLDAGRTEIVFDLRGVNSLGSSMLHVLFRGLVQTNGRSGSFVLVKPNASVWARFETSGLDRAFASAHDLKGALAKASIVGLTQQ